MLTPIDLVNHKNLSGYDYVVRAGGKTGWQASRNGGGRPHGWRGPLRRTPEAAAMDYCMWANGYPTLCPTKIKKPTRVKEELSEEVQHALGVLKDARAQRMGRQGYVYCIGERKSMVVVKVGYSVNPEARVCELQTGNWRELRLLAKIKGTTETERALHLKYARDQILGEWFLGTDALLAEFGL